MRPRVAALILLAAVAILAVGWWVRSPDSALTLPDLSPESVRPPPREGLPAATPTASASVAQADSVHSVRPPASASPATALLDPVTGQVMRDGSGLPVVDPLTGQVAVRPPGSPTPPSVSPPDAEVRSRVAVLDELALRDDPGSLQLILADLTDPNRVIRAAALAATLEFGSRDAIPTLNQLAEVTDDPEEKTALKDAAEYLALPTLTELRARLRQSSPD